MSIGLKLWQMKRPNILVVGDLLVDVDIHGHCDRFAAEAAGCAVFAAEREERRPGGAGAVAVMCQGLGAEQYLWHLAEEHKRRYFASGRQLWRADYLLPREQSMWSGDPFASLLNLWTPDIVLVADYGKGTCTESVLRATIDGAAERGIPCLVDPARGRPWRAYQGCTAIKCNRQEWREFVDTCQDARHPEDVWPDCTENVIVTDGPHGLTWRVPGGSGTRAARPRTVRDVTGAGDMVLAGLGVCLAGGMSWGEACTVAVAASGAKVERHGAAPVSRAEVVLDLIHPRKIIPAELLPAVRMAAAARGRVAVWANGCFDLLHTGHVRMLAEARAQGDILVVGVDDDAAVAAAKGPDRPVVPWPQRAELLAGLASVDYVVGFGRGQLLPALEALCPGVLAKGGDYTPEDVVGAGVVESYGGRVHIAPLMAGCSTTATLSRVRTRLHPASRFGDTATV